MKKYEEEACKREKRDEKLTDRPQDHFDRLITGPPRSDAGVGVGLLRRAEIFSLENRKTSSSWFLIDMKRISKLLEI